MCIKVELIFEMWHMVFQVCLVLCVLLFMVYVFYTRYNTTKEQQRRLDSDTYRSPPSDSLSAHQAAQVHGVYGRMNDQPTRNAFENVSLSALRNGTVCASPTPPLAQLNNPLSQKMLHNAEDTAREYLPVWIPVPTNMSKLLMDFNDTAPVQGVHSTTDASVCEKRHFTVPDFADVFRGYQRLALLTVFTTFGRRHKIIFIHKGNWHEFLPNLSGSGATSTQFRSNAMDESMRMDYIKANILAYYGGYWIPSDTIMLQPRLHDFMMRIVEQSRTHNTSLVHTPLVVVSQKHELHTNQANTFTTDTTVMFAEPHNPTLIAIANQMQVIVTRSFNNSGYTYNQYFERTIHEYKNSGLHPLDAASILVLPPSVSSAIDDRGDSVTVDHYFRQRPLDHLPHPEACWCVIDSTDQRISNFPMYDWFVYLSEEAIVQNQLWIAIVFRRGLQMDSAQVHQGNYQTTVSLQPLNHPLRNVWVHSWRCT